MPPDRGGHTVHYLQGTGHAAPNHPYFKSIAFATRRSPGPRGRRGTSVDVDEDSEEESFALPTSNIRMQGANWSGALPGSTAWLIELVLAALRPNSVQLTRQLALSALRTLTFGDATWREVNAALLERAEKGIADVEIALQRPQTPGPHAREDPDVEIDRPVPVAWAGRKLPMQQRTFGNGTSQTSFIIAPEDYVHDAPPTLVDAPSYCLFCIPRKDPQDPDDPYHMWVLNAEKNWDPISVHAAHPDPSQHPYMLKIRTSDKTPSWVLPESLHRESQRAPRRSQTASATVAGPSTTIPTEVRSTPATQTDGASGRLRGRTGLRFSEPLPKQESGRSNNASAGPSRR